MYNKNINFYESIRWLSMGETKMSRFDWCIKQRLAVSFQSQQINLIKRRTVKRNGRDHARCQDLTDASSFEIWEFLCLSVLGISNQWLIDGKSHAGPTYILHPKCIHLVTITSNISIITSCQNLKNDVSEFDFTQLLGNLMFWLLHTLMVEKRLQTTVI